MIVSLTPGSCAITTVMQHQLVPGCKGYRYGAQCHPVDLCDSGRLYILHMSLSYDQL